MGALAQRLMQKSGSTFSPTQITGLRSWMKADAITGLANGDPVSTWPDSSPAGINATGAATERPTWQTSVVNGLPVVRFDGSNDQMPYASHPNVGASAGTLFVVQRIDNDPSAVDTRSGPSPGRWGSGIAEHWPYTDGNIYNGFGSTARKTVGNPAGTMAAFRIYAIVSAPSDWRFYLDGGTAFFSTATNTVGWNASAPILGRDVTWYFDGDLAELIAYNTALSTADLNRVGAYLAAKYGLTWSNV